MPLHDMVAAAATRPVQLITAGAMLDWEVAGAGHTDGLRTDPAGWEHRVTSFLTRALGR